MKPMLDDGDCEMFQALSDELHDYADNESIPKIKGGLKVIRRMDEERTEILDKFALIASRMDGYIRTEFDLPQGSDVLQLFRLKLEKEREELKAKNDKLNNLKAKKSVAAKEIKDRNAEVSMIQKACDDVKVALEDIDNSNERRSFTLISKLMSIVYKYDKEGRCVAVALDENRRVEMAVEVDKENVPEVASREEVWAQFEKTCEEKTCLL